MIGLFSAHKSKLSIIIYNHSEKNTLSFSPTFCCSILFPSKKLYLEKKMLLVFTSLLYTHLNTLIIHFFSFTQIIHIHQSINNLTRFGYLLLFTIINNHHHSLFFFIITQVSHMIFFSSLANL